MDWSGETPPPEPNEVLRVQIKSADTMAWVNQVFSPKKIAVFQSQAVQNKPICYSPPVQDSEALSSAAKRIRLMLPEFSLDYMQVLEANSESTNQYSEDSTSTEKKKRLGSSMFESVAKSARLALDDKENIGLGK